MTTKHTPGPWIATPMGYIVTADRKNSVAVTNSASEADAPNANLIAAAPDLLAALEALTEAADDGHITFRDIDSARAAIAKARGE